MRASLTLGRGRAHPGECNWERQNKIKQRKIERGKIKAILTVRAIKPLKSLPREVMETSLLESFQNRQSNGKCAAGSNPVPTGSGHDDLIVLFPLSFPRSVKLYCSYETRYSSLRQYVYRGFIWSTTLKRKKKNALKNSVFKFFLWTGISDRV